MPLPDSFNALNSPGAPILSAGTVLKVSRIPLQLLWNIQDMAFTRYVMHYFAWYHDVTNFGAPSPSLLPTTFTDSPDPPN